MLLRCGRATAAPFVPVHGAKAPVTPFSHGLTRPRTATSVKHGIDIAVPPLRHASSRRGLQPPPAAIVRVNSNLPLLSNQRRHTPECDRQRSYWDGYGADGRGPGDAWGFGWGARTVVAAGIFWMIWDERRLHPGAPFADELEEKGTQDFWRGLPPAALGDMYIMKDGTVLIKGRAGWREADALESAVANIQSAFVPVLASEGFMYSGSTQQDVNDSVVKVRTLSSIMTNSLRAQDAVRAFARPYFRSERPVSKMLDKLKFDSFHDFVRYSRFRQHVDSLPNSRLEQVVSRATRQLDDLPSWMMRDKIKPSRDLIQAYLRHFRDQPREDITETVRYQHYKSLQQRSAAERERQLRQLHQELESIKLAKQDVTRPKIRLAHADSVFPMDRIREAIASGAKIFRVHKQVPHGVVAAVHVNQYAANQPIEDTYRVDLDATQFGTGGSIVTVADGHGGGNDAAAFVAQYLHAYLAADFHHRLICDPDGKHMFLGRRGFLSLDKDFLDSSALYNPRTGLTGACVVTSHIFDTAIHTAWAGDCRAVVGQMWHMDGMWNCSAVDLSKDHALHCNPDEVARLKREHPDERDIVKRNRVKGRLQPTRGIGDGMYKDLRFWSVHPKFKKLGRRYASTGWFPPYTTAEPEISVHKLTPHDRFLIVATDGLWDVLSSNEAVRIVSAWRLLTPEQRASSHTNAAALLTEAALLRASPYVLERAARTQWNKIAPGLTKEELLTSIVSVPNDTKRRVHDDITVVVVFLDDNRLANNNVPSTVGTAANTTN